jgi:hypothetical protein
MGKGCGGDSAYARNMLQFFFETGILCSNDVVLGVGVSDQREQARLCATTQATATVRSPRHHARSLVVLAMQFVHLH